MSQYGCVIPKRSRKFIARTIDAKAPLNITRAVMGQGVCPEGTFPGDLEGLVDPVAEGRYFDPYYDGEAIRTIVEYRGNMGNCPKDGFWIREFGVFAQDAAGKEMMVFYGTLGDRPQWVNRGTDGGLDIRRFEISITRK